MFPPIYALRLCLGIELALLRDGVFLTYMYLAHLNYGGRGNGVSDWTSSSLGFVDSAVFFLYCF